MIPVKSFFAELKRRKVHRVAIAYAVAHSNLDPGFSLLRNSKLGGAPGRNHAGVGISDCPELVVDL